MGPKKNDDPPINPIWAKFCSEQMEAWLEWLRNIPIASYLDISINELMKYLHISLSTWHRRKKAGKLDFNLSDKVFQVSKLLEYAENVFGNSEKVLLWFKMPSIVFENLLPVELIGSLSGINLINDELIRIEHGVFI